MPHSFTFEAIGTWWTIDTLQPVATENLKALQLAIQQRIETYDKAYSRFRADSLVSKMAEIPGRYKLPPYSEPLMDLYVTLYKLTNGLVTPLIGDTLVATGYDAAYTLEPKQLMSPPSWDEAIEYHFPFLTTKQPVLLDFGAAGKGYLVDIVADILVAHGIENFCVDAGGDMAYRTTSTARRTVGLENPDDTSEAIGVAKIYNQSLCGSAGNRRAWGEYHHILNPQSLVSPKNIKAVWVTASTALLADGLTTALFFAPAAVLAKHFEFEYALVYNDSSLEHSPNFPAEFFTIET